jgi:hypothetical protein
VCRFIPAIASGSFRQCDHLFLMGATPSLHTQLGYKMAAVMQGAPDKVVMRHVLPHMALDRAGPER